MLATKDKIKQIYGILPQLNCSLCGFESCGQFAKAVAEGKAAPFGCRQDPWAGYSISEITGTKVPLFGYHYRFVQPAFGQSLESLTSLQSLGAEVKELSKRIEDMLDRIDSLERKRGKR